MQRKMFLLFLSQMVGQTQACRTPKSPSQPADVSLRLCSRRKLAYSNGKTTLAIDRGASEDGCLQGNTGVHLRSDFTPGNKYERHCFFVPAGSGDGDNGNLKRKRKAGSPLPEMPDLSQTQVYSQASPCSSESLPALPDSPQVRHRLRSAGKRVSEKSFKGSSLCFLPELRLHADPGLTAASVSRLSTDGLPGGGPHRPAEPGPAGHLQELRVRAVLSEWFERHPKVPSSREPDVP